jgi:plasmid replication initiation protein
MAGKKQVNNIIDIQKHKNNVVTKGNPLVEFPYKLSLLESKILLFVISLIQPDHDEINLHRFKVKDLIDFLNLKTNNYDEIRNTVRSLQSKILTINKEDGSLLDINWMSSAEYFKGGDIEVELSIKLSPYLLQLKEQFISYKLFNILNLSSVYSIRFYEFLKKYERIGEKTYTINELKKIFQIENEYKLYGHFKTRVLDNAQRDLKENTDIYFTYTEIKD